jgi:hypothetical protein
LKLHRSFQRRLSKLENRVGAISSRREAVGVIEFCIKHRMLPETADIEAIAQRLLEQRFSMKKILKEIDGKSRGKLPCELVDLDD